MDGFAVRPHDEAMQLYMCASWLDLPWEVQYGRMAETDVYSFSSGLTAKRFVWALTRRKVDFAALRVGRKVYVVTACGKDRWKPRTIAYDMGGDSAPW